MIVLSAKTPINLYKKAFLELYKSPNVSGDLRNYKDSFAILTLDGYKYDSQVYLDECGFHSSFDYDQYIVGGNEWMKVEIDHYNNEYIQSGKIVKLVNLFEFDPYTRRGVISLWDNPYLNFKKPFPCTVYVHFRRINGKLNMNYHMRANDAYKILLMDIHIALSLHQYVADQLNLRLGVYNHIVDSLHFYKEHIVEIDRLYKLFKMS